MASMRDCAMWRVHTTPRRSKEHQPRVDDDLDGRMFPGHITDMLWHKSGLDREGIKHINAQSTRACHELPAEGSSTSARRTEGLAHKSLIKLSFTLNIYHKMSININ